MTPAPAARGVTVPFGYYGSKRRLARRIVATLPPHAAWVEAFCGSAAVTLAKEPAPIEVINDLDGEVVNLFQQLRDNGEKLCRRVALTPYARAEHAAAHVAGVEDPVERARLFLVNAVMSVNATRQSGTQRAGFSVSPSYSRNGMEARVSRWYNLPDKLAAVAERLRTVRIERRDALEVLGEFADRPGTLMYLDPPYLAERSHRYAVDQGADFHASLLEMCSHARCMLLISGYHHPMYARALPAKAGWTCTEIPTTTRDTSGRDFVRNEVFWHNAAFELAVRTANAPLLLSPMEREHAKLNPGRDALETAAPAQEGE